MLVRKLYYSRFALRLLRNLVFSLVLLAILGAFVYWYIYKLPYDPTGAIPFELYVEIPEGSSAVATASLLKDKGIIRTSEVFVLSLQAQGLDSQLKSGTYYFDQPASLDEIITRLTQAEYELPVYRITLFEGEPNFKYAKRLAEKFPYVSESRFRTLAAAQEGYLFPDTYLFPIRSTDEEIIEIMRDNFENKIAPLATKIEQSPYSLKELVTMASLVESEAGIASYETKRRVAGVLWRRVEIGMPIQADAVFSYIYETHLPRVLYRHLRVDSPYNIYKNKGLPPGPIGNPSLDSIKATLDPVDEGYLYYLTGNNGKFYFATSLAQHEYNRSLYLQY